MATILSESVELFLGIHGNNWYRVNDITSQSRWVHKYHGKWATV